MAEAESQYEDAMSTYNKLKGDLDDAQAMLKSESERFEKELTASEDKLKAAETNYQNLAEQLKRIHEPVGQNGPVQLVNEPETGAEPASQTSSEETQRPATITIKINAGDEVAKGKLQHLWSYYSGRAQLAFEGPEDVIASLKTRIAETEKEHTELRTQVANLSESNRTLRSTLISNETGFKKQLQDLNQEIEALEAEQDMNKALLEQFRNDPREE
ncbi:hypothetical protein BDV96DRAFT_564658 [Lophiotrema nucula]|uniref:Uncharacterized protein n=1 Tax=Lophiotrema nucula TaxID=690887 RepID=A0A6A5ZQ94_9PLEO|nr:hypothetical protein BDV96DRAFT_564658 [Lophiotrema nucula]